MFMDGKIHNVFSSESIDETLLSGSNSDCGENSFFNTACYEVISKYDFVENSSKVKNDLVFTITGTREAYDIYDDYDKRGEAYPIKETHHFSFNETSMLFELDKEYILDSFE